MKKRWDDSNLSELDYLEFNVDKHLSKCNKKVFISNCFFNNKMIENDSSLISILKLEENEKIYSITFNEVVFNSGIELNLNYNIVFQNCNFYEEVCFINFKSIIIENCFSINEFHLKSISNEIQIDESRINHLEIHSSSCKLISLTDTFVSNFNICNKESNNEIIDKLSFEGFIENKMSFSENLTFKSVEIICDSYIDEISENSLFIFGEINIQNVKFLNNFSIKEIKIQETNDELYFEQISIKKIDINFSNFEAAVINISKCNVDKINFSGNNNTVPIYISDSSLNEISFKNYQMDKEGLISLRNIKNKTGLLQSKDTLISNRKLFFQNCDLSNWESFFIGTFFEYQAISSNMPLKIFDEASLKPQQKLDIHNLWLKNTNKEENIINWHQLKRKQFQTVWEVEKERANKGKGLPWYTCLQKLVQELNDYGTNWWKPTSLLIVINLVVAIFSSYVLKIGFENGEYYFTDNLISFVYPLEFDALKQKDLSACFKIALFFLKIINAILIFQIVSAFRVYYRK